MLDGRVRAFHCAEVAHAFDNFDRCLISTRGMAEAGVLSAKKSDAWMAFAALETQPSRFVVLAGGECETPNVCAVKDDPDRSERAAFKT